jgi:hypothetical protein
MSKKSVPAFRFHKASGQARTMIDGRHVYLGKYNSFESRQKISAVARWRRRSTNIGFARAEQ